MDKIKVSKEVKMDLDGLLFGVDEKGKLGYLAFHLTKKWSGYKELNRLSYEDFSIAVLFGYELEKTPEEKLLENYKSSCECNDFGFDDGYKSGILYCLETLNIKIKGINA